MAAAIDTLATTSLFTFRDLELMIEVEDPEVYEELRFQHEVSDGWKIVTSRADVLHTWLTQKPRQKQKKSPQKTGVICRLSAGTHMPTALMSETTHT